MTAYIDNVVVFQVKFTWADVVDCLGEERKVYDQLSVEEKQELMEIFSRSIGKGLEAGIMHDWPVIMRAAMDESGINYELASRR